MAAPPILAAPLPLLGGLESGPLTGTAPRSVAQPGCGSLHLGALGSGKHVNLIQGESWCRSRWRLARWGACAAWGCCRGPSCRRA